MNQQQVEESIEESSHMISEVVESQILSAIQILTIVVIQALITKKQRALWVGRTRTQ